MINNPQILPGEEQLYDALNLIAGGGYPRKSECAAVVSQRFLRHLEFLREHLDEVIPFEQMPGIAAQLMSAEWLTETQNRISENTKAITALAGRL